MKEIPLCLTFLSLLALGCSYSEDKTSIFPLNRTDFRLARNALPERYVIELKLEDDFYETRKFTGNVNIIFQTTELITQNTGILLNTKSIQVNGKPTISIVGSSNYFDGTHSSNNTLGRTKITFSINLEAKTKYNLSLSYNATLFEDMYGFYISSYLENNQTEWVAATQFAPTYARRAFPCFDEPSFKATFDVIIKHPLDYFAISNSRVTSSRIDSKTKSFIRTEFQRTPKMSTYVLAFLVSKFSAISRYADAVRHQVVSRYDHLFSTDAALTISPRILNALDNATGVSYTVSDMDKIDHVALPHIPCGAMENWGIVTYKEAYLFTDAKESSVMDKKASVETIAHELSHMWFGNLRTCEWWNATWLNEGFATYFQHYIVDQVESGWDMSNHLVLEKQFVQSPDSLISTRPLTTSEHETLTPVRIREKFNDISYKKGASILYMMEKFMGTNKFLDGIKTYMSPEYKKHFENVKPEDLWNAWKPADLRRILPKGATLQDVMTNWAEAKGYPVVDVTRKDNKVQIKAHRFFSYQQNKVENNSVWYIPISYTTSENPNFQDTVVTTATWINYNNHPLELDENLNNNSWIAVNLQSSAYIRVNYDDHLWSTLSTALQNNSYQFHLLNRVQFVDDAFNLAHAGMISYKRAFSIIEFLKNELEYYPWYSAFKGFQFLKQRTTNETALTKNINNNIKELFETTYRKLQLDNSTKPSDVLRKSMVLSWACQLNYTDCVENVKLQFLRFKENNTWVDPNLRGLVYCTGIQNSGRKEWEFLYQRLNNVTLPSEVPVILEALGCTSDVDILKSYLAQSINSTSIISKQDAHTVFLSVINGSPQGVQAGLDFLVANITKMIERYRVLNVMPKVINSLAEKLINETQIKEFTQFLTRNEVSSMVTQEAQELCQANLVWLKSRKPDLVKYFEDKYKSGSFGVTLNLGVFLLSFLLSTILL